MIGTVRVPFVLFGVISPAMSSQPRRTWIRPAARSTSLNLSARSSPRRRPA